MQSHMTFLHILQHHLPRAAIPKPGSFHCDSSLPLLLDIQTGGQRALSEIPVWGEGSQRGRQISSQSGDGSMPAITVFSGCIRAGQITYVGPG